MLGWRRPAGSEAFALQALALQLAGAANRLGGFPGAAFGRLLVVPPELHFAEYALALHFLLQGLERLIDIVIANEDLHEKPSPVCCVSARRMGRRQGAHRWVPPNGPDGTGGGTASISRRHAGTSVFCPDRI